MTVAHGRRLRGDGAHLKQRLSFNSMPRKIGPHTHEHACASGADCAALGSSDTHCAVAGGKSSYSRWSRTCRMNGLAGTGRVLCVDCCRSLGFKSVFQMERKAGNIAMKTPPQVMMLQDKSSSAGGMGQFEGTVVNGPLHVRPASGKPTFLGRGSENTGSLDSPLLQLSTFGAQGSEPSFIGFESNGTSVGDLRGTPNGGVALISSSGDFAE